MDEYLPPATLDWCSSALEGLRINMEELKLSFNEGLSHTGQAHYESYLSLRELISQHIALGGLPFLYETAHPTGGVHWIPEPRAGS